MAVHLIDDVAEGHSVTWYADEDHGLYVVAGQVLAWAARNHLAYFVDVDHLPPGVRDAAEAAHRELMRNADADLRHYVNSGRS